MIIFDKLSKRYHHKAGLVLTDISVHIRPGQFVFLTGPSGAGKSTMLRLIYGAELPSQGTLRVGGVDLGRIKTRQIPRLRRNIGVIFQDFRLAASRTVLENVALPLHVAGMRRQKLIAAATEVLRRVNLLDQAQCRAGGMSGGEQQRVAVARALAAAPPLLLADEPTGNLDPDNAREVMRLLLSAHQAGATVLVATHDPLLLGLVKGAWCLHLAQGRLRLEETL
jgi:cell division transport system ATP-binding protein